MDKHAESHKNGKLIKSRRVLKIFFFFAEYVLIFSVFVLSSMGKMQKRMENQVKKRNRKRKAMKRNLLRVARMKLVKIKIMRVR